MKYYYYVNIADIDTVRIQENDMLVNLQGRSFVSVRLHSVKLYTVSPDPPDPDAPAAPPVMILNTYSGNGFSTNRRGVCMSLLDDVTGVANGRYIYTGNYNPTYNIQSSLTELSFSFVRNNIKFDIEDEFSDIIFILELEDGM